MSASHAPDAAPLATLRGVGKTFDNGVAALSSVNAEIRSGEFLSILGASGCGKTTLLRLIAGLIAPSAGRIEWRGGVRPRDIGFVFQEPALMPWADIAANVRLPLELLGRGNGNDAGAALEKVGLTGFASAYPGELSGGMKMRASIARALAVKPKLLLMDEPFAALDELTRFRLNDELLGIWRDAGCTVVFVTHSVSEAAYLSTRTLVLSPRPGTVAGEISFPPAAQLSDPQYRTSPEFAARTRELAALLSNAAERAA